jgi:hypothetical protein
LLIPNRLIFASSVGLGIPNLVAAPLAPRHGRGFLPAPPQSFPFPAFAARCWAPLSDQRIVARLPFEPRLVHAKNVVVAQDHGSLNYVCNSRTLAGQPWAFNSLRLLLSTVPNFFRECIENPLAHTPVNGMARAADAATGTKVADELFFQGAASLDEKAAIDRLV